MRVGNNFCTRCGHGLEPEQRFCVTCGHAIRDPAAAATPTPTQRQPPPEPAGLGRPTPPAPAERRRASMLPLATVLVALAAGGGSAAAVLLIRHSHGQPAVQESLAALAPTTSAPAASASPATASPTAPPSPTPSASPTPPTQVSIDGVTIDISAVNTDPDASAVATTFATYFGGIDAGDYTQAWDTYSASLQGSSDSYQSFAKNVSTTQDSQVVVQSIQHDSDGNIDADVSFQSHQAGQYGVNQGETCTNWSLDYNLVPAGSANSSVSFLINGATGGHTAC